MGVVIVFAVVAMLLAGAAYAALKLREDIAAGRHGLGCLGAAALLGSLGGIVVIWGILGGH